MYWKLMNRNRHKMPMVESSSFWKMYAIDFDLNLY